MKSTGGNPPELLDPFAGGGAIPLEAQRLGLKAHAHDLNPVAVMINKAMIEIPPRFSSMAPVNPDARTSKMFQAWSRAQGLAEDVRYYGEWMKQEAYRRIGHLYPGEGAQRAGRRRGNGHRLDLGADGKVPESGLRVRDAACQFLCTVQKERERGMGKAGTGWRPCAF